MEVILLEQIKHLGNLGEQVAVKSGYGRNYLIPQRKAVPASPENIAEFEERHAEFKQAQKDAVVSAQERAAELQEIIVEIAGKVGVEGKLFGSVSAADIANAISDGGIKISKHEIRLPDGPIRQVGEYDIKVHLHPDVDAFVTVQVIAED
ncbi:MAG: 50S ribosomal protein L9 [Gammaproteobacteria bacterium]|nr:MAG: 50S ribosomal protein L9 [Gammaproteobacteria bacterium]RKZ44504.1 MAG: 50S ribosomal protein L9 [Gammaproteobacteria bacterium]RKZ74494.1 MAG: 50S ribosomal protein L9 [Gammaproteobacteria bacterium]